MIEIRRGEVWLVDLGPPGKGREIHGSRPFLVISADEFNNCPADLVMVLPITTTRRAIPSHIEIVPPEGGLKKESFVKCDQVRTISKARLKKRLGNISKKTIVRIEDALRMLLCL